MTANLIVTRSFNTRAPHQNSCYSVADQSHDPQFSLLDSRDICALALTVAYQKIFCVTSSLTSSNYIREVLEYGNPCQVRNVLRMPGGTFKSIIC